MNNIDFLKSALGTSKLTPYGSRGGGCINEGQGYLIDSGPIYLKKNSKPHADEMFKGEFESLARIYATNTVRIPKPIRLLSDPEDGAYLAIEYIDMKSGLKKYESELGSRLADLHNFNAVLLKEQEKRDGFISAQRDEYFVEPAHKFGFSVPTSATPGFTTDNSWCEDWVVFYGRQKIEPLINKINQNQACAELNELWNQLSLKLSSFFTDCRPILPALLHGDMWSGNVAETEDGPVFFDPMSFYGHSEFEFGIAEMFSGFSPHFYDAYHEKRPRQKGFSRRNQLYQFFHHLNHWFIFGDSYKASSLSLMRRLCKSADK